MPFPHFLGQTVQPGSAPELHREPCLVVFKKTLTANQSYQDLRADIDKDWDHFELRGLVSKSTGNYSLNYHTEGNRPVFSSQAQADNVCGTGQLPVEVDPPLTFRGGTKIGISMTDLSGATNNVELLFIGYRYFRI